jgi:hypothetical protein
LRVLAPILWICVLALAIRLLVLLRTDPVAFDSGIYFEMAQFVRAGNWAAALAYHFPPFYPALIAGMQFLGISAAAAGTGIALAADVLVLLPLAAIARAAAGEAAAWGAALLWAVHPYAVRLGVQALTDAPTALFLALAVWAGIKALEVRRAPAMAGDPSAVKSPQPAPAGIPHSAIRNPQWAAGAGILWAVGAGAASGLAYLLRPEGIEPAIVLAVAYFIWPPGPRAPGPPGAGAHHGPPPPDAAPRRHADTATAEAAAGPRSGRSVWRRAAWAVAPLAGWAIVASPYVAAISLEAGSLTFSKKKSPVAFLHALGAAFTPQRPTPPPQSPIPGPPNGGGNPDPGGRGANPGTIGHVVSPPEQPSGGPDQEAHSIARSAAPITERERSRARRSLAGLYAFQRGLVNGIHPLVLVFGLVGAIALRRSGGGSGLCVRRLLLGLLGLHLAVLIGLAAARGPAYLGGHHFFPMVVYALPFAGAGLAAAIRWGAGWVRAPRLVPVCALSLLVAATAAQSLLRRPGRGTALRPAAQWIRAQTSGTPIVVTDMAKLTYHAGAQRVEILGPYDDVIGRARARSAQFVAFYPDMLRQRSPEFMARLGGGDLEFARAFPEPSAADPGRRFEVYRLKPK